MKKIEPGEEFLEEVRALYVAGSTIQELCRRYEVGYKTMHAWLKPLKDQRTEKRMERNDHLRELLSQGHSKAEIARMTGLPLGTVYYALNEHSYDYERAKDLEATLEWQSYFRREWDKACGRLQKIEWQAAGGR